MLVTIGVEDKLKNARIRLERLGEVTNDLVAAHPEVFDDAALQERLSTFRRSFDEAHARLTTPTLSIATIGTTSSGKSTLVNALVGRRIAPIEAGEMSGGVLTLRSGSERRLIVEGPDDAPWEVGTWEGITDADAYTRIRDGVLRPYHDARRSHECLAPQVVAIGPLLPSVDSSILGLPPDLGIELNDLPGLKSVLDRDNLAVIQTRVHKAFSLVAFDYMQTDEEHRKKLLEELVGIVKYLEGRPDSMIFVLNRVDQRGMDDEPIETRIAALRREIKEVLNLKSEPDVLPFEARLLYRAQCAWGAADESAPTTSREERLEHLRAMFEESATSIKRRSREDSELRAWCRDLEDQIDDGELPSDRDLRKFLEHARDWSGGEALWRQLRTRISDSFAELVILPALFELLNAHQSLTDALRTLSKIRHTTSIEELNEERERLATLRIQLQTEVTTTGERFRLKLSSAAESLKSGDQVARQQLTKELGPGFEGLLSSVSDVTGDLTKSLIAPVRDALKANRGVYDLEEALSQVIEPTSAKELARAYDAFSRRIPALKRDGDKLTMRIREDDAHAVKQLREIERDARRLYQRMRHSLSGRAEFTLQGHAESIRGALEGLRQQQAEALKHELSKAFIDRFSLEETFESTYKSTLNHIAIELPSQLFVLPEAIKQERKEKDTKVGTRKEVEEYESGTCFKSTKTREVQRDIIEKIPYLELALADEDGMARQWSEGVGLGESSLWETLRDWMTSELNEASIGFSRALTSVLSMAEKALEEQRLLAEGKHEEIVALWTSIDRLIDELIAAREELHETTLSERD